MGYSDAELSILIVDDEEMTDLNREYRQVDSTTDVLSFSMLEGEYGDISTEMLGDVVICAPAARAMAAERRTSFESVLDLLLVHGTLHLLGFDHGEIEDARRMDDKTMELLKMLGYSREEFEWYGTGRFIEES